MHNSTSCWLCEISEATSSALKNNLNSSRGQRSRLLLLVLKKKKNKADEVQRVRHRHRVQALGCN